MRDAQILPRVLCRAQVDLFIVAPGADRVCVEAEFPALPGLSSRLFTDESPPSVGPCRTSVAAQSALRALAASRSIGALHVEGHYLLHLAPEELLSRTVLVEHNVESLLLDQRRALGEAIAASEIELLRRREEWAWRAAARVVALTPDDAGEIRRRAPGIDLRLIPNGWDHLATRPDVPFEAAAERRQQLLFLANHAYLPNQDALAWLLAEVFPHIRRELPDICLVIAGANLTEAQRTAAGQHSGVRVVGAVPHSAPAIDAADVVLCPLRIGGGIKVKMIESIRRAAAIVSTSVGVQGIPEPLRSAVCVADEASEFAAHVVRLCRDGHERQRRREALWRERNTAPTWDGVANQIADLWHEVARDAAR